MDFNNCGPIVEAIVMTEKAKTEALKLQINNLQYQQKVLRLYLEGKGCDGFYYGVTFDEQSSNDTSFDQGVTKAGLPALPVVVDADTLTFVRGAEIDWVDDERGRGFLVHNPHQKSFRGKFFKREAWQQKLKNAGPKPLEVKNDTDSHH